MSISLRSSLTLCPYLQCPSVQDSRVPRPFCAGFSAPLLPSLRIVDKTLTAASQ
jgi:hypothetical protein